MASKKSKCIVLGSGQFCRFIINVIEETEDTICMGYVTKDGKKNPEINTYDCLGNDGYLSKSKKASQFDNDYERMMKERGEIRPNRPR